MTFHTFLYVLQYRQFRSVRLSDVVRVGQGKFDLKSGVKFCQWLQKPSGVRFEIRADFLQNIRARPAFAAQETIELCPVDWERATDLADRLVGRRQRAQISAKDKV